MNNDLICEKKMKIRPNHILWFLTLMALFNTAKWLNHIRQDYQALDFRTYSLAAKAYFDGENPYDNHFAYQIYCTENPKDSHPVNYQQWNNSHNQVVYAPQFVWIMYPFTKFSFHQGKWIQLFINLVLILLTARLISLSHDSVKFKHVLLAMAAFKGTWFALDNGQPLFFCVFLISTAWYFYHKKTHKIYPGILLGLACFKFTLVVPFALLFLIRKEMLLLSTLVLTALTLNLMALGTHWEYLGNWTQNMNQLWAYVHNGSYNPINTISTGLSAPLASMFGPTSPPIGFAVWLLALISSAWVCLKKKFDTSHALLIFILSELVFGQHLIYDCFLLIPVAFGLQTEKQEPRGDTLVLLALMCLPVGTLATKADIPLLHFLSTLAMLVLWLRLQIFPPLRRNSVMKNPN